jgi:CrcB protein
MIPYLLVAAGGAVGSIARYAMVRLIDQRIDGDFPWGTLAVNVVGSLLIGIIAGLTDRPWIQQLLMVGVMGGYTTFSSFSLQTVRLLQTDRWMFAGAYIVGSVVLCIVGTIAGLRLAELVGSKPS